MPPEKESEFESEEDIEDIDPFAEPEKVVNAPAEEDEITPKELKNRAMRRMEDKWRGEREANIALNARLEALSESQRFAKDTEGLDENASISRIYGTDSPEGKEATRLLQKALQETREKATESALERFREEQYKAEQEVVRQQDVLDGYLETIEDEFEVDMTSNSPAARKARQGFFTLLEKLSPKQNGVVTDYADPLETWELYQKTREKPNASRAKELSSRSMTKSGTSATEEQTPEDKATQTYLKSIGIL